MEPGTPTERFSWSVLWRDVPAVVWGTTAVLGLLLALSTLLYPTYRGPDEPHHVDLAVALQSGDVSPLWRAAGREYSHAVSAAQVTRNARLTEPIRLADRDAVARGERPSYEDALATAPDDDAVNHLVQHPPGYYALMAGVLQLLPGWQSWDFQTVVTVLRLATALLVLPLPLVVHAAARRATGSRAVAVVATAATLCVPQLVHIGSVVNNDALTIATSALCALLVVHVLRGDLSLRTAGWLGLVLGLALLSKGLTLGLVPVVTAAYVLAGLRRRAPGALAALVVAGAVSGAVGGWWWLRNLALYGTLQPDGRFPDGRKPPAEAVLGWADGGAEWARSFVELFTYRFFFDDPSGLAPRSTSWVLAAVAGALGAVLVLVALAPRRRSARAGLRLGDRLVLLAPLPLYVGVVALGSYEMFTLGSVDRAMQGRYAFGALCGVAVLAAEGLCRAVPARWHRFLPGVVLLAAAAMQALAAWSTLRIYWWSPDAGVLGTAQAFLAYSPWPPAVVGALLALTGVVVLATALSARPAVVLRDPDLADGDAAPTASALAGAPVQRPDPPAQRPDVPVAAPYGR